MKKIVLSSLLAISALTTTSFAANESLEDSLSVGVYGGISDSNIEYSGSESGFQGNSIELRAGFVKYETHRFSIFFNHQINTTETLANVDTEVNHYSLGVNYDFQIKNLDTNTALFFGPSVFLVSATVERGTVKESAVGVGGGLRVGVSQQITDGMDLEIYHQYDVVNIDIEGVDMKDKSKTMLGLSFKF